VEEVLWLLQNWPSDFSGTPPNTFLYQDSTYFIPVFWVSGNQRPETPTSLLCEGGWVCLWER